MFNVSCYGKEQLGCVIPETSKLTTRIFTTEYRDVSISYTKPGSLKTLRSNQEELTLQKRFIRREFCFVLFLNNIDITRFWP